MPDSNQINTILSIYRRFIYKDHKIETDFLTSISEDDESQFIRFLGSHKLLPISYEILKDEIGSVQESLLSKLKARSMRGAIQNMAFTRESQLIQNAFFDAGIVILPYKGVTFAQLFYNNPGLRNSLDIDFGIREEDLIQCHHLMLALEFQESNGTINEKNFKKSRAFYLDYPWQKKARYGLYINVEFHLAPAHKALYVPCDFGHFIGDRSTAKTRNLRSFTKAEHALFAIIHHGAVDLWGKLLHLIDLHQIMTVLDKDELDELVNLCEKARIRKFLDLGLLLNEELFGISPRIPVKHKISKGLLDQIKEDILETRLAGKWSENNKKLWYHLLFRDSVWDQIKTLRALCLYGIHKKIGFSD